MRAKKWAIGLALAGIAVSWGVGALALASNPVPPPEWGKYWSAVLVMGVLWVTFLAALSLRMVAYEEFKPAAILLVITAVFGGFATAPFFLAAAVCSWRSAGASRPSPAARAAHPTAR